MARYEALIIGGSAGSLDVLIAVLPLLNQQLSLAIILVIHRKNSNDSQLTGLISAKTRLRVKEIEEKETISEGTIYLAPADYHVLIEADRTFSLDYSEKVNFSRPSIDVTFQSAAEVYRESLVCLLLSGSSADGVHGLKHVKKQGGMAAIQNPDYAAFPFMPKQAASNVEIDKILDISEISSFINNL